jgi:hypothetical protein
MDLTRTGVRALAGACALTLLFAACGGDDDSAGTEDETEQTAADEPTTTEAAGDETTTTAYTGETTTTTAEEPDSEGDPDAVALAERINLTIDDFADGWTETPANTDDGSDLDDCFVDNDIEASTVGQAETGTFSIEGSEGQTGQLVTMQTVVLDSADTAVAVLAEGRGEAFITCTEELFTGGFGEGASATLAVLPDDLPYTEESFGVAGDIAVTTAAGEAVNGAIDLHLFRTGEVVSFTATLDLGDIGIEATLGELYPVVADRFATEVG